MKEVLALVIPLTVAAGVIVLLVTSKRRRDAKEKEETQRAQQAVAATSTTAPQTAAAGGANDAPPAAGQGGQTSTTGGGAQTPNSAPAPTPKKKFLREFFFGAWRTEFKTLRNLIILGIVIGLVVLYGPGVWEKATRTYVPDLIPSTMGVPTPEQQVGLDNQKKILENGSLTTFPVLEPDSSRTYDLTKFSVEAPKGVQVVGNGPLTIYTNTTVKPVSLSVVPLGK